jgi:hypothetical protein
MVRQEIKHAAMEFTLGMLKKKTKCPTISKEPQQSLQAYFPHISSPEQR